jgi:activator of HSP90 ATPase
MQESIQISTVLPSNSKEAYLAYLSSLEHQEFTGSKAFIEPRVGGKINAWDGYIKGEILELDPYNKIVQTWRTTDFPEKSEDSLLELLFEDTKDGLELTLIQTEIPEGQSKMYEDGWHKNYFEPMKKYFE